MPKPRKYEQGGKTMSLYFPNALREQYEQRAALLGITRNELIIKVLQGRNLEPSEPATNGQQAGGQEEVPVATDSGESSATGSPGEPPACAHQSTVDMGFLTRCQDCGAEVG